MKHRPGIASLVTGFLLLFSLSAHGAETARVQAAATAYVVSGVVKAPGGVIAYRAPTDRFSLATLLDFLIPPAQAKLSGLVNVPNGTPVELMRINNRGVMSDPIATTTTQYGRYQFNLTALRQSVSSRLAVRVGNVATGGQMRAFVSDQTVDIDPVTETAVRLVLDTVADTDGTLDNFTARELEDLSGSLDLLTSANDTPAAADIESSIAEIRTAVAADAGISRFVAAIAQAGQTGIGPGDIGDFFPFTRGIGWTYNVRETEGGIAKTPYTSTVTIGGTRLIGGVATTVFRDSNPDGDGVAGKDFYRKTTSGLFDWEPVKDGDSRWPFQFVRFPAAPGSSFTQSLGDMGFNQDIDGDGTVERFTFTTTTTVVKLGTVSVPAGDLPKTLKIRTVMSGGTTISSTRKRMTITMTAVEWYTQNLGMAKQKLNYSASYDGRTWRDSRTMELTGTSGFSFAGEFPLDRFVTLAVDPNDIIYEPVSGKLFASVRSSAANYADNVVVINPRNGVIMAAIPVGSNPGALAVSDDGQFLYVGLGADGEQGSIRQISIPTMTAGTEWPLSGDSGTLNGVPGYVFPRYAHDIAVQPGHPETIAVVTSSDPFPSSYGGRTVRLFTDGVEHRASTYGFDSIFFSNDAGIAYGTQRLVDYVLAVTSDDITTLERRIRRTPATALAFLNDRFFMNTGVIIDAADGEHIGNISFHPFGSPYSGDADTVTARVAFAHRGDTGHTIQVFDANTLSKTEEMFVPIGWDNWDSKFVLAGADVYGLQVKDITSFPYRLRIILAKKGTAH